MEIKYKKRPNGGYYAFGVPEGKTIEQLVIVKPVEHFTPNKAYRLGWCAIFNKKTYFGDTRKEAVESALSK